MGNAHIGVFRKAAQSLVRPWALILGGCLYGVNIWVEYYRYVYLSPYAVRPTLYWVWILFVVVTLHQWSANFFCRSPDHLFNSYWRPTTFETTRTKLQMCEFCVYV